LHGNLPSIQKQHPRYGTYHEILINGKKCIKKEFDYVYSDSFKVAVESKDLRMKFDPAFFGDLIDFEAGTYDQSRKTRS
jgi:hypothetical protein